MEDGDARSARQKAGGAPAPEPNETARVLEGIAPAMTLHTATGASFGAGAR